MDILDRLEQLQDDWEEANVFDPMEPVPDGKYQVVLNRAEFMKSQAGEDMLKWTFAVVSSGQKGRVISKFNMIRSDTITFLKTDLARAGVKIQKLTELPQALSELAGRYFEVQVKTRKDKYGIDRTNVYINREFEPTPEQTQEFDAPPF
jgi:hypothetical protein